MFEDGIVITDKGISCEVPEKFDLMFQMLKERENRNGLVTISELIKKLGNMVTVLASVHKRLKPLKFI